MKTTEFKRQIEIENMAREAAKASGIMKALDQALQYGKRDAKDYGGVLDAATDIADSLERGLSELADEINTEKWQ